MNDYTGSRWLLLFAGPVALCACTTLLGDDFEVGPGAGTGAGPQLVSSTPAHGEAQAAINPTVQLRFDRPVDFANAAGKISVTNEEHTEPQPAQIVPCDEPNPRCIGASFPPDMREEGRLTGDMQHTVIIHKELADTQGNTNDVDTAVSFRTFFYDLYFFDDSEALTHELAGLAYSNAANAVFLAGGGPDATTGVVIRRIDLDADGWPAGEEAWLADAPDLSFLGGDGGTMAAGLDFYGGRLVLSLAELNAVLVYPAEDPGGGLGPFMPIHETALTPPNHVLDQVENTARFFSPDAGDQYFFGHGWHRDPGPGVNHLIACVDPPDYHCDLWLPREGLLEESPDFYVAFSSDGEDGYLFIANGNQIHKVRLRDKQVVNTHVQEAYFEQPHLRTDWMGRLYVADRNTLLVYETSETEGFTPVAAREFLPIGRFAVRERGDSAVQVIFGAFAGNGLIGATDIAF